MKSFRLFAAIAAVATLLAARQSVHAQSNVNSFNIVGYVNELFAPGQNLFCNPLNAATNTLSNLFQSGSTPNGTTISLWDAITASYYPVSTYSGGTWSVNLTLNPGTGAMLTTSTSFLNTFVGDVLYTPGPPGNEILPITSFSGGPGLHLLSSVTPVSFPDSGFSAFNIIIGRAPQNGEQFIWLDELTQTYHTTTYNGTLGQWDNGAPVLAVGEAAFFNVGPVPEPSVMGLFLVGLATLTVLRRCGQKA